VKAHSSTVELHWILFFLSYRGVCGISGVEVKFVEIRKNTGGEGDKLAIN
jgi:hypothetical protein